jgi:hypothetical protein
MFSSDLIDYLCDTENNIIKDNIECLFLQRAYNEKDLNSG